MKQDISTITGSAAVFGAPTITPTVHFLVSTATLPGEPVYNLNAIMP